MPAKFWIAKLHSLVWHLFYGMWRGYRETTSSYYAWNGRLILGALTSTDSDWKIVKVFWEAA